MMPPQILGELHEIFQSCCFPSSFFYSLFEIPVEVLVNMIQDLLASQADSPG